MTSALLLALGLASAAPQPVPGFVIEALEAARADAGAVLEPAGFRASLSRDCEPSRAEALRPVVQSGNIALRVSGTTPSGKTCQGSGIVRVRVLGEVLVVTSPIGAGEALDGRVKIERREVRGSAALREVAPGAVARISLRPGRMVEPQHITQPGAATGTPVRVVLERGAVRVAQQGVVIPCGRTSGAPVCARLSTGKRVEGHLAAGELRVEMP